MLALTDADFNRLHTYIKANYGIDLSKKKQLIVSRLSNTLASRGYRSFSEYVDEILTGRDKEMVTSMLNKLTTNYTYFLREEAHFQFLQNTVLPDLAKKHARDKTLSIWMFLRRGTLYHLHVPEGIFWVSGKQLGYPDTGYGHLAADSQ